MLLKLKDAITLFEWCSELKVNWEKSALSSVNVVEDDLVQTANRLGCMAEKLPFLYLGLPLRDYPRQKEFWQLVVDQIHKKLDRWKRFNMSRGSRHALNNPVQASSHHSLSSQLVSFQYTKLRHLHHQTNHDQGMMNVWIKTCSL